MKSKKRLDIGSTAEKTAEFYVSLFDDAGFSRVHRKNDGTTDTVEFEVLGQRFCASNNMKSVVRLSSAAIAASRPRRFNRPEHVRPKRSRAK